MPNELSIKYTFVMHSAIALQRHLLIGFRVTVFVSGFSSFPLVFLSTLRRLELVNSLVFDVAMSGLSFARSFETVMCTPYFSMTRECELTTIMRNGPRLRGISLLYAGAAILSVWPDCDPGKVVCQGRQGRLCGRLMLCERNGRSQIYAAVYADERSFGCVRTEFVLRVVVAWRV